MNDRFAPIYSDIPHLRKPGPSSPPPILEFARAQPDFVAMDDVADFAQTVPRIKPTDIDALMELEDADEGEVEAVQELLSQRPVSTPNGKYVGIAMDACEALRQIITTIRGQENFDQFSEVDVDKWAVICRRGGYSL